ncbi:translocation associated membrane protein, putative [Plasmodium chabaudi adami]|uniref:Translocation associated membrane protein, putative n=1 Tax=Plasmodium chabaudi adami TaxID=5826 RepID=A0A1C6XT04_PLACE|nr:translocation associated membrane protein, putative [Plasmodium chabaudi adami]
MSKHYFHTLDEYTENIKHSDYSAFTTFNPKLSEWTILALALGFIFMVILRYFVAGIRTKLISKDSILYKYSRSSILDQLNKKYDISKKGCLYKWKENFWFGLWHSFSLIYNIALLVSMSGYLTNTDGWVKTCFKEPTGKCFFLVTEDEYNDNKKGWPYMYLDNNVHYFYIMQISFWLSCLFYLKYEIKRKDYYVFIIHHLATLGLLLYSQFFNLWRAGLVVLFLHDIVDVWLYISKTINYSKPKYQKPLTIFYSFFVLSFFFFRIILFLFYFVIPLSNINMIKSYTDGFINSHNDAPMGYVPVAFLWMLMMMHFYWFYLTLKMTRIFIEKTYKSNKSDIVDIRSDNEDDEDDELNGKELQS